MITPCFDSGSRASGDLSAAMSALLSVLMIAGGVAAGTSNATSVDDWNPGTPASAMVGRSGAAAIRAVVLTPSVRILPLSAIGNATTESEKPALTSPATSACSAGPPPRYGT